ncbi:MAG: hypothetical protein WAM94_18580, partial [Chromatiaceae bacterium]
MLAHFFPVLPQPKLARVNFEALLHETTGQSDRPNDSGRTANGSPAQKVPRGTPIDSLFAS